MAAQEKHGKTQRDDSPKDPAYGGSKHANDLRGSEPDLARMVWVLQAQQSKCLWERRRLRARTTAQHPEKAKQKERARTRKRSSALAKCLLHHNGLVHLKTSTRCGMSIFLKVTTNWRAGCKKSACPVRREGRSFPSSLPLCAPESAHQQRGESPRRTEHWLSVAEGNCVVERRGGGQPEANNQSIIKKMMNSIRPDASASMRRKWRSPRRKPTREGTAATSRPDLRRDSERRDR